MTVLEINEHLEWHEKLTIITTRVLHVHRDGAARAEGGRAEGRHVLGCRLPREAEARARAGATSLIAALLPGTGRNIKQYY